jgi:hypothetical protein
LRTVSRQELPGLKTCQTKAQKVTCALQTSSPAIGPLLSGAQQPLRKEISKDRIEFLQRIELAETRPRRARRPPEKKWSKGLKEGCLVWHSLA